MAFLAPLFLFGLFAVLIPLAIHLIRRDKPPKVVFSTLRFFKKTTRKQFLFQKFQQWLLMLLRALAVCLIAFAFARPFMNESLSGWANLAPRSVVVLVDVSMSMGYEDNLDKAKQNAKRLVNSLAPGDEASIILFSETAETVHGLTGDLASLTVAIDGVNSTSFQGTRYFPAIRLADEVLADSQFDRKEIVLISDFQENGMVDFDENWKLKPGVDFVTDDVSEKSTSNLAITGVKSPAYLRGENQQEELFVRVRSMGSVRQNRAEIIVSIDDKEQLRKVVDLQDQSESVVSVPITFSDAGSHVGKISVLDSRFTLDNDFYFTVDVLPKIKVLVVNGESSNNWFDDESHWFELAVNSAQESPFEVTDIEQAQLSQRQLDEHNVVVLLNTGELSNRQANALTSYVEQGGSILFAPGDRVQAGEFNRQFASISPATIIDRGNLSANDYLLIADVEKRHPILRPLEVDWSVRFDGHWATKPDESADVLMRFDNSSPTLIERQVGKGRTILFASSLDMEWNNLPLQGMYLPFVHEILKYLAHTPEKKPSYVVGEKVTLPDSIPTSANVLDPFGARVALKEGDTGFNLSKPGVYKQSQDGQDIFYAVNRPIEESNFTSIDPADILDKVINPETTPTQSAAVRDQLKKAELEKPQRFWWWLLLVVGLLLLVESFVANRTHR
ncbi:BatA domain-containing protein [Aurantivibrio infirmus]